MGQTKLRQGQLSSGLDGWIPISDFGNFTFTSDGSGDPQFTISWNDNMDLLSFIGVGMKIKWTQNGTVRYGFVTYADANGGLTATEMVVYGGTDYNVENTTTYPVSNIFISREKAPYGFPMSPDKWSESYSSTSSSTLSNITSFAVSAFGISVPIGIFDVSYLISLIGVGSGGSTTWVKTALGATSTPLAGSQDFKDSTDGAASVTKCGGIFKGRALITNTSKTTIYILTAYANSNGNVSLNPYYESFPTVIRATCAYL